MNPSPHTCFSAVDAPFEDQHLTISCSWEEDVIVVSLAGGLVGRTSGDLFDALTRLVKCGARKLILDVSRVRVANRAGLRSFIVTAKMLQSNGGQMRIVGARAGVLDALEGLSLGHLIHLDETRTKAEVALARLGGIDTGASSSETISGYESTKAVQRFSHVDVLRSSPTWERDNVA